MIAAAFLAAIGLAFVLVWVGIIGQVGSNIHRGE